MNRLDKYYGLLEEIYGKRIVKAFTTKNEKPPTLKMNDVANNQKAKKNYDRKNGEGCVRCKKDFRNEKKINFFKRILEFPGWTKNLDFSESHAKEIMIIGEAPTTLKDQINIAFGLGYYPIDSNGKLDFYQLRKTYSGEEKCLNKIISSQTKKNGMWKYLNLLFSGKLDDIKRKIYITDLCKCNDDIKKEFIKDNKIRYELDKNKEIWAKCLTECLIKEIELINPKLIIFQGWSSYIYLRDYLINENIIVSEDEIREDVKMINIQHYREEADYSKNSLYYNPFYGKLPFNGKQIHYFIIFHQSNFFGKYKAKYDIIAYTNRHSRFIKDKILAEVLN